MKLRHGLIALALLALAVPASAQQMGYYGLGPRVGVSNNPDQIVGGMQFNLGTFAPRLQFQPNFEVGIGDDWNIITVTAPVHYRFKVNANIVPYAGGGVTIGYRDHDVPNGDSDFDIALKGVGGVEWPLAAGNAFFLEMNVGFGDFQDQEILAGWMFGAPPSSTGPSKANP
jgi:hypothetical protein